MTQVENKEAGGELFFVIVFRPGGKLCEESSELANALVVGWERASGD